jgi:hypothetical protein
MPLHLPGGMYNYRHGRHLLRNIPRISRKVLKLAGIRARRNNRKNVQRGKFAPWAIGNKYVAGLKVPSVLLAYLDSRLFLRGFDNKENVQVINALISIRKHI